MNDTFTLNITADAQAQVDGRGVTGGVQVGADNRPFSANIIMDDIGGGSGWFFDNTPLDDVEFTSLADSFQASFIDATTVGQARQNDFYRTITHEIGHALGVRLDNNFTLDSQSFVYTGQTTGDQFLQPLDTVDDVLGQLAFVGQDQVTNWRLVQLTNPNTGNLENFVVANELWQYTFRDGSQRTITFTESGGGHFYEGVAYPNVAGADQHLNELMNPGRTVPVGNNPAETTRQFISELTMEFLADAYGYTVALPSTLDSAHVMLDSITGTLLVQGSARDPLTGAGVNDVITIERVTDGMGDDIRVTVDPAGADIFTERVPYSKVSDIVIHGNGGTDTTNSTVEQLITEVNYVVSSNEDAIEATGLGDGVVDLSAIVPGNQTTLRGAVLDARLHPGADAIYVGRGNYQLTRGGPGTDSQGDMDIIQDLTIIGAGAGQTVINATGLGDRIFDIEFPGHALDITGVTLRGGVSSEDGGAIRANVGTTLDITDSAFVMNTSSKRGWSNCQRGGIAYFQQRDH